jgi:hypothetical protein
VASFATGQLCHLAAPFAARSLNKPRCGQLDSTVAGLLGIFIRFRKAKNDCKSPEFKAFCLFDVQLATNICCCNTASIEPAAASLIRPEHRVGIRHRHSHERIHGHGCVMTGPSARPAPGAMP